MRSIIFFILLNALIACDLSHNNNLQKKNTNMTPQLFTIKLGIQPDKYIKLNNLDTKQSVNEQPAGLNFYQHRWSSDNRGTIFF